MEKKLKEIAEGIEEGLQVLFPGIKVELKMPQAEDFL